MHDDHIGSDDEFHGSIPPTSKMAEKVRPEVWKDCLSFLDDPIATHNGQHLHRVSKKTSKIIFVITTSNFYQY